MRHLFPHFVLAALMVGLAGNPALACDPAGEQVIGLRVTPGEFAEPGRTLEVTLYENNCARIQRPVHFRSPGRHLLRVTTQQRSALDDLRRDPAVRGFDVGSVLANVAALQQGRAADGGRELFGVFDADRYELTLRDGAETRELSFDAVFQYAERYPEVAELRAMANLVGRMQLLAEDARLVSADEASPNKEVRP